MGLWADGVLRLRVSEGASVLLVDRVSDGVVQHFLDCLSKK